MANTVSRAMQVSAALRKAASMLPETMPKLVDVAYDKKNREWNCWLIGDTQGDYLIGRGRTALDAADDFISANKLT